jgi:tRNA threonylcarbamoyladenosine biosynthesis protein TsaB
MRILSVDTASKSCSVGIVEDSYLLAELTIIPGTTHSRHLMALIQKAIDLSGMKISDMDGYAVTKGPGSFTGLRIGISSVKGLAAVTGKPVVGVSSLDALASQAIAPSHLVCPLLDARKGEVYFSYYKVDCDVLKKQRGEAAQTPEEAIEGIHEPCIFIGDGAQHYERTIAKKMGSLASFAPSHLNVIRAFSVANIALGRFKRAETEDAASIRPRYIRKSDAEIKIAGSGLTN